MLKMGASNEALILVLTSLLLASMLELSTPLLLKGFNNGSQLRDFLE